MFAKLSWRLILILGSAGLIAYLTFQYLDSLQQTTAVVVSDRTIAEQTEITEEMLTTVNVEASAVETLLPNRVQDPESVIGAITRQEIESGKPVLLDPEQIVFPEDAAEYVTASGNIDSSEFIPDEMRLYTLALSPQAAVDNSLQKGDHVDVVYTAEDGQGEFYSRMLIQFAEVYEVESYNEDSLADLAKDSTVQHVTLLVNPQEVVALGNAVENGSLSLALNPSNGESIDLEIIRESTLES
ncbi:hypothetical protein DH09_17385 [Bacillaceae bacterium JMAK1]|nr:hypothetical protein DH09_17385 [Bacillaceae bacterium JMAK1]